MTLAALLPLLAVLVGLLAASALASGSETALFGLTHADRARLRRLSPRAAAAAQALLVHPRRLLILILLLNTSVNTIYFVVSSVTARHFEGGTAAIAFSALSVMAIILFGEVLPKSLAAGHRVRVSAIVAPVIRGLARVIDPVGIAFELAVLRPLARLFRPAGAGEARAVSVEEISSLLETGAGRGVIDEDEQQLLSGVVALGTVRVREVMTPRVDVRWVPHTATAEDLVELVRSSGHTKLPLCRGSLEGGVIGMVNSKRFLAARAAGTLGARTAVSQWAEPVIFVPDRARLDQLLDLFRSRRAHVALCVDELGGLTGLVEVEDVVRQLVRPIDSAGSSDAPRVTMVAPGRWRVPGRLAIRQWSEFFGPEWDQPNDRRVSTIAGLVFARMGRVPRVGDEIRLGNMRLIVESMNGRVIEAIGVRVDDEDPQR